MVRQRKRVDSGSDPSASERQRQVDDYFRAAATEWNAIYEDASVRAVVIQERRAKVLAWIDELELTSGERVLDVGCGAGLTTLALAQRGHAVVALDMVDAMLALALRRAAEARMRDHIAPIKSDVHHLSFADDSFGLVIAMGVVPWVHSPRNAVAEMARTLRPGGHLILTAHNLWSLERTLDPGITLDPRKTPVLRTVRGRLKNYLQRHGRPHSVKKETWVHPYSRREVDRWISSAGLEKVKSITLGFGPFGFFGYQPMQHATGTKLHHLLQGLANRKVPGLRSGGQQYIVLAKKRRSD